MLTWCLYAIVVSALAGAAAFAAERALRLGRLPLRWAWIGAMLASVIIPVTVALWPESGASQTQSIAAAATPLVTLPALTIVEAGIAWTRWAMIGWIIASSALALGVLACGVLLARRRRGWRAGELDGAPVLWSEHTGPAVVGVRRPQIVVPRWAAELPEPLRRLLVAHEREHIAARDPMVFHALLWLAIVLPWNVVLWWQLRRFRAAMELDCDARVLRAGADRRGYADLLLNAAERFTAAPLPVLAFAWPGSLLKRRLRLLAPRRARYARLQVMAASAVAVVLAVQACGVRAADEDVVPGPDIRPPESRVPPGGPSPQPDNLEKGPAFTPYTTAPELRNREHIRDRLDAFYPPLLRGAGIGGNTLVWLLIDESGDIVKSQVNRSSGREELDSAALRLANEMKFKPAENYGQVVKVWIALPIVFATADNNVAEEPADAGRRRPPLNLEQGPAFTPYTVAPKLRNIEHIAERLNALYPPILRGAGIGGSALVWLLIDESGDVVKSQINRSSGREALDAAALRLTEEMEFTPAEDRGEVVQVWVALPIVFEPGKERQ